MDQLVAKEDSLTELSKHVSITLAKFDSETESLINMLHKRRDNQVCCGDNLCRYCTRRVVILKLLH